MAHESHDVHDSTEEHAHHVTPPFVFYRVYVLLVIGMLLTILAAGVNMGPLNNVVAMVIAVTKATLVVLFFMQVKYGTRLTWLWAALGFIWFTLLFLTMQDYWSRNLVHVTGW